MRDHGSTSPSRSRTKSARPPATCAPAGGGIDVHPQRTASSAIIEGNRDHPGQSRRWLCAKGSAGIMQHHAPARLRSPLKRVGRGVRGSSRRSPGDGGAGDRRRTGLARCAGRTPKKSCLLHRTRPVAVANGGSGPAAIRHAQLFRAWRLLFGEHGGRRYHDHRRRVLGVRLAGLGPHQSCFVIVRSRGKTMIPIPSRWACRN